MQYLNKTFTVYFQIPGEKIYGVSKIKKIDPKHRYVNLSGMCGICALSKEGHKSKYGR